MTECLPALMLTNNQRLVEIGMAAQRELPLTKRYLDLGASIMERTERVDVFMSLPTCLIVTGGIDIALLTELRLYGFRV